MSVNVDPQELEKFSQLAHRWWDPNSEFKPLHDINPLRLDWIDRLAGLQGKRVLDVGCGGGILSESMAERGAEVFGIDLSERALKVAELHLLESGRRVRYRKAAVLKDDTGLNNLLQLVRTYFKLDGHHIQFNVVDARTLRAAQEHPEQYRDLIVRVAGYSDYFCDLSKALQEEIIARTEHAAFG